LDDGAVLEEAAVFDDATDEGAVFCLTPAPPDSPVFPAVAVFVFSPGFDNFFLSPAFFAAHVTRNELRGV